MRVLIIGTLAGQLSAATKIAFDKGAKVLHADNVAAAMDLLRTGRGADLVMVDVHEDIAGLVAAMKRSASSCRWSPAASAPTPDAAANAIRAGAREFIPAAAGSGADRRGAGRRRDDDRPMIAMDPAMMELRIAGRPDRAVGRLDPDHRRKRRRQGSDGALRPQEVAPRRQAVHLGQLRRDPGEPAGVANCSATRRAPSPARSRGASASSRKPTAARCCSTKSPRWICACRPSCCAPSRSA